MGTTSTPRGTTRVVAVTGGSGLIGRRVLPLLAASGAQVRVLTRAASTHPNLWQTMSGDLLDPSALRDLVRGADAVVHLAGIAHTSLRSPADHEHARRVNVDGTRALLQAALEAGVSRFLLASSAHVYKGQRGTDVVETSPTCGEQAYAAMKLEAESAAAAATSQGLSVAVLRPCLTYGPGVRYNLQMLMRALRRGYYVQVRGAHTVRSLASVDTVATAIQHFLVRPECVGAYNIADRDPVQLEAWVTHLAEIMGARCPRGLPLGVLRILADAGTAAAKLGFSAPLTRTSLAKLTEPFTLDMTKLANTGFRWPKTQEVVLREMVDAEFAPAPGTRKEA